MNDTQVNEASASINRLLTKFIEQDCLELIPIKSEFSFIELFDIAENLIKNEYFEYAEKLLLLLNKIETNSSILSKVAFCQKKLSKIELAKSSYEIAIKLNKESCLTYYNYGVLLQEIGDYKSAQEKYNIAIKLNPNLTDAYYNLGNIDREVQNYHEAKKNYEKCIEIDDKYEDAYYNLGVIYEELDDDVSAKKQYNKAIQLNEDNIEAHWNKSLLLLKSKNFCEGFNEFEWRLQKKDFKRLFPFPKWGGEDLGNKKVIVYCEQGFGDAIHFSRYIYDLVNSGAIITLECRKELLDLFEDSFPNIKLVERGTIDYGESDYDFYIPLLSLPYLLKLTFEKIDGNAYLTANKSKKNEWQKKIINGDRLNIGIAWAGNKNHQNDKERSIDPALFNHIIENKNYNFYSLQIDTNYRNEKLINLTDELKNFDETAAFISNLDLVICVDTAVAHLAGSLGIETWILIPYNSDWRWFKDTDKSPWYNSVRLFRKNKNETWGTVLKNLERKLTEKTKADISIDNKHKEIRLLLDNSEFENALEKIQSLLGEEESEKTLNYLGILFLKLKNYSKAEEYFQKAISLKPSFSESYSNLGIVYFEQRKYEKAVEFQKKSVELNTQNAYSFYNLAYSYQELGDIISAINNYEKAVQIRPDYADARFNLSLLQLMTENYLEGWKNYNKWIGKTKNIIKREFSFPEWNGQELNGKTLLVYADQAYGDAIQFARYLPLLKEYKGNIIFECPDNLVNVFKEISGINKVVSKQLKNHKYNYHYRVQLMKLPELLNTKENLIPKINYDISVSEEIFSNWQNKIVNNNKYKVGFVWTGNEYPEINKKRHMPIDDFAPLFEIQKIDYYSLQLGDEKKELSRYTNKENVFDFTSSIKSFEDTAAIISQMDLIVTIDTSVAHLAGTMERKVWTMLAFVPDWRWGMKGDDCSWYPNMRLFRQKERGNWKAVIDNVCQELKNSLT